MGDPRGQTQTPPPANPPLGEPPRRITGGQAQVGRTSQEGKPGGQAGRTRTSWEDKLGGQSDTDLAGHRTSFYSSIIENPQRIRCWGKMGQEGFIFADDHSKMTSNMRGRRQQRRDKVLHDTESHADTPIRFFYRRGGRWRMLHRCVFGGDLAVGIPRL